MTKYNLSTKRKDTGKYWSFGTMKEGDPEYKSKFNIGIKVSPEFMALVADAGDGGWINLNAYPDDREDNGSLKEKTVDTWDATESNNQMNPF